MAMKVDNASSVESRPSQITVNSPSAALTGTSKMSKFGMKSGFVIPKNKLSGSLVPVFRGAAKVENETIKEENNKQSQRKTKWGTDLTQDATVRRGRALAYQTRVEQITKQLKSGAPEKGDEDHTTKPPNEIPNDESSRNQVDDQQARKLEMLELEKREAIGEILKLNPSYKAPPDYKPLMKEASIPVPVKLYPGLNIVSLILGTGNNTQKRLEEETGARIQIKGTKAGSAEEVEITLSDKTDTQSAYEKLFVHVSADTFEKVDAAVGLIELLVTPVSGKVPTGPSSVSGDGANVLQQNQDTTSSQVISGPVVNPGMMHSMAGSMQPGFPPQVQFHPYPAPWFPTDHMRPLNNFAPMSNSSAPMPNNAIQFPSPQNTSNMPQFFGGYPPGVGSSLAPRNPAFASHAQQQPPQGFQRPYFRDAPPNSQGPSLRMHPASGSQTHVGYPSFSAQPNHHVLHQSTSNQPRTAGPGPGQVMLSQPQPFSSAPSGQPPNMQSTSSGWPASTVATPSQPAPFQRPPVVSQPLMMSGTGSSNVPGVVMSRPSGNMGSPASFPPRSSAQLPNTTGNHPVAGANFSFVVHQRSPLAQNPVMAGPMQAASSMPRSPSALPTYPRVPASNLAQATVPALPPSLNQSSLMAHMQPVGLQGPAPNQPMVGVPPVPPPLPSTSRQLSINTNSASGSLPSFASPKPPTSNPQAIPATTPKPHRPSSGDFTFQPPRSPLPVSQTVPRPSDQSTPSPSVPPNTQVQPPPAPQTPSYRPAVQSAGPQNLMQNFPNTPPNNQMIHPQTQIRPPSPAAPSSFPGNPSSIRPSPRFSEFSNLNPPGPPHMGPRSFTQAPQMSNFPGRFPPQMMNPPQMQQNQPNLSMRPGSFMTPHQNQQYGNNPAFSSGRPASSSSGNQVYDPFSPTSVSSAPQHPENPAKVGKPEEDPEYDDLMASVGVR